MILFMLTSVPLSHMHCKYQIFCNLPCPTKKAAKLSEMEAFGGYHAENKENSVVPAQNFQSNSQQSSVMHSNVMHFTNSYGSSPTFVFNFGK